MDLKLKNNLNLSLHSLPQKGFTLIELAIILVVIGLLVGLGVGLVGILTKQAKLRESREIVRDVYESIIGYVATNKKLPNSLGDLSVRITDSYGNTLEYFKVTELTANNLCVTLGTYLTVTDNTSSPPSTKTNVAFIVFSKGENGANNTGTGPFTINEYGVSDYDDIVWYTDIDTLRNQICTTFKITTESLPVGTEEFPYPSTTLEATDGTLPYTWSILSGSLPDGLILSGDGVISGTPTQDGSYNFTVQVTDSDNPQRIVTKSLAITINPNKPRITTEFLNYGTQNQAYAANLSATGGLTPYTWNVTGLPAGLSLLTSGNCTAGSVTLTCNTTTPCICGTPSTSATFGINIDITDSRGRPASKTLSLTINPSGGGGGGGGGGSCPALSLTPPDGTSWSATVGQSFSQTITVSGGQTPYTNTQCGPLTGDCGGLNLTCTNTDATISGTPTTAGTCSFTVSWQDSCSPAQTISGTYYVNISPPTLPPTCTLSASPGFVPYNQTTTLSWSITNGPADGTFSPSSGTCTSFSNSNSGSCTTAPLQAPPCTQTFTLTVSNANGSSTCSTTVYVGMSGYRVWNNAGRTMDYLLDGVCSRVNNNNEITSATRLLNVGETIFQYWALPLEFCETPTGNTLTYNQAMSADSQGDCDGRVNFSGTDR